MIFKDKWRAIITVTLTLVAFGLVLGWWIQIFVLPAGAQLQPMGFGSFRRQHTVLMKSVHLLLDHYLSRLKDLQGSEVGKVYVNHIGEEFVWSEEAETQLTAEISRIEELLVDLK